MALTPEDVKALNAIFAPGQHEFNRGFVYITERAICDRLEAVDPSWNFDLKSIGVRDSEVVVVGTLTLKGVTREGVGMQKIMEKAGEAEKGAATDALKRAARLFGVGRYLLDAPEEKQFADWLKKLQNGSAPGPAPAANGNGNHFAGLPEVEAEFSNQKRVIDWVRGWNDKSVVSDDLLAALGVTRFRDYPGTFKDADQTIKAFLTAKGRVAK